MKPRIFFLVGPTASGKTALSLVLAKVLKADIISCDSMQVYRGMDILTSKPSVRERGRIRHYCMDVVSPAQDFNVSRYRLRALKAVKEILERRRLPLFVGGSGLYMSVVVDGIFRKRTEDEGVRGKLFCEAQENGSQFLHERLIRVDPDAANKIHPNDARRIIRALEVFAVTGKTISAMQSTRTGLWEKYDIRIFCLDLPRETLYRRIDARVEKMFAGGFVDEVKRLARRKLGRTAGCAIGINEVKGYLSGAYGLETAKQLVKRNTRLYAKRQLTWFRKDKRIVWINGTSAAKAAKKILRMAG
jgi:tRNA dimethylallyltransferase